MTRMIIWMGAAMLIGACSAGQQPGNEEGDAKVPTTAITQEPSDMPDESSKREVLNAFPPPTAESVLYFIYGKDGDGATSYEIESGRRVSYWHGHEFWLGGKKYFTGFTYVTEEDAESGDTPGEVSVGQATFELTNSGGKQAWKQLETDGYIGQFGRLDKLPEVDGKRKDQSYTTGDGRLVLAIPVSDFDQGVTSAAAALFVYDPALVGKIRERHWAYVGSVPMGSENSAACDGGKVMPCVSSAGTLAFVPPAEGKGLPSVKISMSGTEISAPDKIRSLGASDAKTFVFDPKTKIYGP